ASGLKINLVKSRLYGIGVAIEDVNVVVSSLGCAHNELPFIYLGLPVGKRMLFSDGWAKVIEFLGSLPNYYLSLFKAPNKVINALKSIRSGLGVGSILAKNLGLLKKWKWRLLIEKDALWKKTIQEFYGADGGLGSILSNRMALTNGLGLMKHQAFLRASLDRLATRPSLVARGISITDPSCPFCNQSIEDVHHVLVACPRVARVWRKDETNSFIMLRFLYDLYGIGGTSWSMPTRLLRKISRNTSSRRFNDFLRRGSISAHFSRGVAVWERWTSRPFDILDHV
ncbi:RNA-directed DNA polymerase, eukaryota, reverse transcriptase zinc-binding domain protein, partial [Tanacetum coccineum]